jgi:branched-subunit amino acid ABC-type transport system permease component
MNQYYFVFINCQSQYPLTYSGTLSFVNANGQQLAYDQIPLVPLHIVLLSIYLIVLLWWILHRFSLFRVLPAVRNNPFLANTCVFVICIRTVYVGLELFKIQQLSDFGTYSTWTHVFSQIFDTVSSALLHCVMLLISLGWKITRVINPRERQFLSGAFSLYAIFDFMQRFCTENLCTAYLLSFYVVKFLILFCILVAINSNIGTLVVDFSCFFSVIFQRSCATVLSTPKP